MPHSFVRFLRIYASIVVLLASGVLAFGVEPVRDGVDAGKAVVSPGAVRHLHAAWGISPMSLQSIEKRAGMRGNPSAAIAVLDRDSFARTSPSARRDDIGPRTCSRATLRVRSES